MMLSNQNRNGIKINGSVTVPLNVKSNLNTQNNSSTHNINIAPDIKSINSDASHATDKSMSSGNTTTNNQGHNNQNITIPATINLPALQSVNNINTNNGSRKRNLPNSFNTNLTLNGVNEPKNKKQKTSQMNMSTNIGANTNSKSNSLSLPSLLNNSMNIGASNNINTQKQPQLTQAQALNQSKSNSISLR